MVTLDTVLRFEIRAEGCTLIGRERRTPKRSQNTRVNPSRAPPIAEHRIATVAIYRSERCVARAHSDERSARALADSDPPVREPSAVAAAENA